MNLHDNLNHPEIENQLRQLGKDWSTDDTFVETVMARLESTDIQNSATTGLGTASESEHGNQNWNRNGARIMKYGMISTLVACVVVMLALSFSEKKAAFAGTLGERLQEVAHQEDSFHLRTVVIDENGIEETIGETWYVRGRGFSVVNQEYIRIDDGEFFWSHTRGNDFVHREKSVGTDELMDEMLGEFSQEFKDELERQPSGDKEFDDELLKCYRQHESRNGPDDNLFRASVFLDDKERPRVTEHEQKIGEQWKPVARISFEFSKPVPDSVFSLDLGNEIEIIDTDKAFEELTSLSDAVFSEENQGFIYAVHRVTKLEQNNGKIDDGEDEIAGLALMVSVRPTEKTLQQFGNGRRRIQPGLYLHDGLAEIRDTSPQYGSGGDKFRIKLADARHRGVCVQWYMLVPRYNSTRWEINNTGEFRMKADLRANPSLANRNSESDATLNVEPWEFDLAVEHEARISIEQFAKATFADQKKIKPVLMKSLDTGIYLKDGTPYQGNATTDEINASEFAKSVNNHIDWWRGKDNKRYLQSMESQMKDSKAQVSFPGVVLSNNRLVSDEYLERLSLERPELVVLKAANTAITDDGLAHLTRLEELGYLYLNKTNVSDKGMEHLKKIESLRKLDIRDSNVTEAGIGSLRMALPNLEIISDVE